VDAQARHLINTYGEVFEARPDDVLKVPGMTDIEIPVAEFVS
jgi:hypothetical protein